MEERAVYYANGLVELQDAPTPHHLRVGGYPELVADHCELVDRVAKLEARIKRLERREFTPSELAAMARQILDTPLDSIVGKDYVAP